MSRPKITSGFDAFADVVPGDVISALEALGLEIIRIDDSGEATCRCPAHLEYTGREDRNPSFAVNVESGFMNCFSCGFRGRFADLVAYVLRIDRTDAVAWIRARGTIARAERLLATKPPPPVDTSELITEAALAIYTTPPPQALRSRGLTAQACAAYGVLWCPREELWITPVRDEHGTLLGWQEKNRRLFRNRPKYLKKSTALFGLNTVKPGQPVVRVESPLDAPRLLAAGVPGAVATYGASVSAEQLRLIRQVTDTLIDFPDHDEAGLIYSRKLWQAARGSGLSTLFVDYANLVDREDTTGLDPGDLTDTELRTMVDLATPGLLSRWLRAG
ncbi:toprim domain-containing protein [Nonomuraea typhae]|uniref:toprim domain-containing protein n=1 Tax=Nonomuraea typhae TaxID=2603600 RepID=UPI0012F9EB2E|nr:toprim domain-containing protein [Nonomuraea typhae]